MLGRKALSRGLWIAFFVTPGLVIVLVVIVMPLFSSMFNSLYEWDGLIRVRFVGLENIRKVFSAYPYKDLFFNALGNNLKWFLTTMLVQNTLGLFLGYLLSRRIAGHEAFKRIFFLPVLFSIVAVGFLWSLYLNPRGLVNGALRLVGLGSWAQAWLGDEKLATFSIIGVNIWRWLGFPSLVFLAAINTVPGDCIEAAYLDGIGEWKLFWRIVFPLIVPAITIIVVLTLIGSLNVFEQIYTMGGLEGGPNHSTDALGTLFYRTAFGSVDSGIPQIGIGSAIGVIIYLLTFLTSIGAIVSLRRKEVQL